MFERTQRHPAERGKSTIRSRTSSITTPLCRYCSLFWPFLAPLETPSSKISPCRNTCFTTHMGRLCSSIGVLNVSQSLASARLSIFLSLTSTQLRDWRACTTTCDAETPAAFTSCVGTKKPREYRNTILIEVRAVVAAATSTFKYDYFLLFPLLIINPRYHHICNAFPSFTWTRTAVNAFLSSLAPIMSTLYLRQICEDILHFKFYSFMCSRGLFNEA